MDRPADVVIIGGGVIGLTTAYALAKEGVRVTVLDRKDFGREASWAGAGILPPSNPDRAESPFDRLRAISSVRFPALSADLLERTGIDNGYLRCGGLEFTSGEDPASPEEWRGAGIEVHPLTEAQTREREPGLAPGLGSTYLLPELAQLRNPRHVKALVAACALLNVRMRPQCLARSWVIQNQRIQGLQTEQDAISAGAYVLAGGAWTDTLLAGLGRQLDIQPVRGQIALLRPSAPRLRHVLMWGDRYLVPRQDGRVLVGSTEEYAGYDARTTVTAQRTLLALACRLVPALAEAEVERCWAGLRPGSADGLPYIGPVPGFDNVFVAAGHFRAGIQLSPGTAQLLVEMLLKRPQSMLVEPFRLDRKAPRG